VYNEIVERIKQKIPLEIEVILVGHDKKEAENHYFFQANIPMDSKKAFEIIESLNLTFTSENFIYQTISSKRHQDSDQANGLYMVMIEVWRKCL